MIKLKPNSKPATTVHILQDRKKAAKLLNNLVVLLDAPVLSSEPYVISTKIATVKKRISKEVEI